MVAKLLVSWLKIVHNVCQPDGRTHGHHFMLIAVVATARMLGRHAEESSVTIGTKFAKLKA